MYNNREEMQNNYKLIIEGIVQGVGFRPFIYNLAKKMGLTGQVKNSSKGVEIIVKCSETEFNHFIESIKRMAPPLSHILSISYERTIEREFNDFKIVESDDTTGFTFVPADVSICKDCEKELFDSTNFRYYYPFINCTNCGPRYSIIKNLPYDRDKTTMNTFNMCVKCSGEYRNPSNRRFHAEPICCATCGPYVYYNNCKGIEAIKKIALLIEMGFIVAVKGLGGYHLICDATNDKALKILRKRKGRKSKPFATMCENIATLQSYINLCEEEVVLLESRESPIVIVKKQISILSPLVNPIDGNRSVGIMLPYTPIHKLLFHFIKSPFLVVTSGNVSDEPICINAESAEKKLNQFTEHFLHHNRDIYNRVDDSVVTIIDKKIYTIRRARGLAPYPILLPKESHKVVIGLGAHLKNTLTLNIGRYAIVSQFIGDLNCVETIDFFHETLDHLQSLYNTKAEMFITDMHPEYYTTSFAANLRIPYRAVQHHLSHMASCMAENNLIDNTIGIVFDGVGLGFDGNIWGGEVFIKQGTFKRIYHLKYYKQPGGDVAAKFPYRMLISYLHEEKLLSKYIDMIKTIFRLENDDISIIEDMLNGEINTPLTSSMGRLFESIGSLLNKIKQNEFEAHTAISLESMCIENIDSFYDFTIQSNIINIRETIEGVLNDMYGGVNMSIIATKFHNTIVRVMLICCQDIRNTYRINDIILSGGVFQNIYLIKKCIKILQENQFNVFFHSRIPANDGSISLGQIYYNLMDFAYD